MKAEKRRLRRGLVWSITAAMGFTLAAGPAYAERDVDELENEIEDQHETLEGKVEEHNKLRDEVKETEEAIEKVEKKLKPYEEKMDSLRTKLADYIAEAHINQGKGETVAILESGSPQEYVERLTELGAASLYSSEDLAELTETAAEYQEELDTLSSLEADLEKQKSELDSTIEQIENGIDNLQDEWRTHPGNPVSDYDLDYIPGDRGKIVRQALAQVGKPYVWAASGPDGYDCSGLMLDAYNQVGISLPHNAAAQYNMVAHISKDELQPGDFVFYNGLQHVGMYIGQGLVVHAPTFGQPVQVVKVDHGNSYYGSGRLL
ncbi:C40 family peptidase [Salininema proteolyticum]|uniref:NlpC/P60 family protein n=1 Tax=Salininema proteolyticum TaxID=1607685 RepID=A0ABV8TT31_9ACTN